MSGDDLMDFLGHLDSKLDEPEMQETRAESPSLGAEIAMPAWPRTMSGDDLEDFLSFMGPAEPSSPVAPAVGLGSSKPFTSDAVCPECRQSELALMVRQEGPFLNITSCTLMPLAPRSSKTKRGAPSGVTHCLRICVEGLPSLKRHKWTQPLVQRVAGLLEARQCPATVRRGELFASLDTTEVGELVCVDICAPRASDEV